LAEPFRTGIESVIVGKCDGIEGNRRQHGQMFRFAGESGAAFDHEIRSGQRRFEVRNPVIRQTEHGKQISVNRFRVLLYDGSESPDRSKIAAYCQFQCIHSAYFLKIEFASGQYTMSSQSLQMFFIHFPGG